MNIYQKLNAARTVFHQSKLQKTGKNDFAKYNYFELSDFLIPALDIFNTHGLCAVVSFEKELATMTITNLEKNDEQIIITSPMGSANLKACHEVQNIGAVETYQRRYLWVTALEIVEHDALDASEGAEPPVITAEQVANLNALATELGVNIPAFCKAVRVANFSAIQAADYEKAVQLMEKKRGAA